MSNESITGIDYASVLADLKAKRDALDKAIAAIEQVTGQSAAIGTSTGSGPSEEIRDDAFFGMSIPDATKKLLAIKKRPQSTSEIANLLVRGGMTFSTDKVSNTVGSVLNRVHNSDGGIVNISRGKWGLAEWYPNRRKNKKNGASEEVEEEQKAE